MIIAIEGVDGSGKTTQALMLVEKLREEGFPVEYVRPTYFLMDNVLKIRFSNNIYSPRKKRTGMIKERKYLFSSTKAFFIALSGYGYVFLNYLSMKFIGRKKILVCDRYFYQFFYDLLGRFSEKLIPIFPKPDLGFFLDAQITILMNRMEGADRQVSEKYYESVSEFYRLVSKKKALYEIDASQDNLLINKIILGRVKDVVQKRGWQFNRNSSISC